MISNFLPWICFLFTVFDLLTVSETKEKILLANEQIHLRWKISIIYSTIHTKKDIENGAPSRKLTLLVCNLIKLYVLVFQIHRFCPTGSIWLRRHFWMHHYTVFSHPTPSLNVHQYTPLRPRTRPGWQKNFPYCLFKWSRSRFGQ